MDRFESASHFPTHTRLRICGPALRGRISAAGIVSGGLARIEREAARDPVSGEPLRDARGLCRSKRTSVAGVQPAAGARQASMHARNLQTRDCPGHAKLVSTSARGDGRPAGGHLELSGSRSYTLGRSVYLEVPRIEGDHKTVITGSNLFDAAAVEASTSTAPIPRQPFPTPGV
jgi:hypothetical protein